MLKTVFRRIQKQGNRLARVTTWLTAAAVFLSSPPVALAQAGGGGGAGDKSYVNQYALVILLVGLALMVLCRPSGRPAQLKPLDRYGDD